MFKHITTLKLINLGWNLVGDEGALLIAEMLKDNLTLRELVMSVKMSDENELAKGVVFPHLKIGNSVDVHEALALFQQLKYSTTLKIKAVH